MYRYFFKNKLIIFLSSVCYILLSFNQISYSKTDLNKYWNLNNNGPITIEQAKEKFFNKKKLKSIEGIWKQDNDKIIAIVFNDNQKAWGFRYSKFVIEDNNINFNNGIKEATIHRTKYEDYFIVFEKSENLLKDKYYTNFGTMNLIGEKKAKIRIFDKGKKKILKEYNLLKIFP